MPQTIIVSQGDLAGVGWHLFLTEIINNKYNSQIVIIGDIPLGFKLHQKIQLIANLDEVQDGNAGYYLLHRNKKIDYKPGDSTSETAVASYENFVRSLELCNKNPDIGLVTLPVSKEAIMAAGISFRGHTEVISEYLNVKTFLCMYSAKLTTVLLTNHIPLRNVAEALRNVDYHSLAFALRKILGIISKDKPVAMLSLNPHAGEGGRIGDEESFLAAQVETLKENNILAKGPLPADSFFMNKAYEDYSLSLACYHDQGLIPFKAIAGLEGINVTLGPHLLRVSPDHGTAFSALRAGLKMDSLGIDSAIKFVEKWGAKWAQL